MRITISSDWREPVASAAAEAVRVARAVGRPVTLLHDGTVADALPHDDPASLVARWRVQSEFAHSFDPEGVPA